MRIDCVRECINLYITETIFDKTVECDSCDQTLKIAIYNMGYHVKNCMFKIETVSHLDTTETIVDKTVCDQTFEIATGQQQP